MLTLAQFAQLSEATSPLFSKLMSLRLPMVEAAQKVYDEWEQDEEGNDGDLGSGGICDEIARALAGVIVDNISDIEIADGGQDGDDHAWTVAYNDSEAWGIDIAPRIYETGGGYSWKKRENVKFHLNDVYIFQEERQNITEIIRKLPSGEYRLYSRKKDKHGKRRNLGTYPTRAGVIKREGQIQAFKHMAK